MLATVLSPDTFDLIVIVLLVAVLVCVFPRR
jgi:hypothetical protein